MNDDRVRARQASPAASPWHVVLYGTTGEVHELLARGQDRRATAFRPDTVTGAPLAFAALQRADPLVLHLCEAAGLTWTGQDDQGNNAWHWAAPRDDMVAWLRDRPHLLGQKGHDPAAINAVNAHRQTPLMIACGLTSVGGDNHESNALALLAAGANPQVLTPGGDTLLHLMALPILTRALVTAGAPINGVSRDGETPLFRAVSVGLVEVVDVLLTLGANPHTTYYGLSPLSRALNGREPEIADRLVQAGADPWRPDSDGTLPWTLAGAWPDLQSRWEQQRLHATVDGLQASKPDSRRRPRL